ncbi:hypothetical protein ACIQWB_04490 [Streptomyces olivaceus]|nr:hypothetical protein [Streptomyces olivaceus]
MSGAQGAVWGAVPCVRVAVVRGLRPPGPRFGLDGLVPERRTG